MTTPLTVGVVGASLRVEAGHLAALCTLPDSFRVTRVFDPAPAQAARFAARSGAEVATLEELLGSVDVVLVCTARHLRGRHVVAACRAGVGLVVSDTPVGLTAADTRFAADVAASSGTAVVVAAQHAHDHGWAGVPALVGDLDGVRLVRVMAAPVADEELFAAHTGAAPNPAFDADGIYSSLVAPVAVAGLGGPPSTTRLVRYLDATATEDLAALRGLLGRPTGVDSVEVFEGGCEVVFSTEAGIPLHLTGFTHGLRRHRWGIDMVGPSRQVSVEFPALLSPDASVVTVNDADGTRVLPSVRDGALRATWREVHRVASTGAAPLHSLADAAADQELLERVLRGFAGDAPRDQPARAVVVSGAGVFGALHIATAAARGRVVRVASRTLASAEARAAVVGAAAGVAADGLTFEGASGLVVAGAPVSHATDALQALDAGISVLVEKPMTATVAQARTLVERVHSTGARFVYGENWAFRPALIEAAEAARRAGLPRVAIEAAWMSPPWGDYLSPSHGGGVFYDAAPHVIELARMLLGRPAAREVSAELQAGATGVDVDARVTIAFEGGQEATIHASWGEGPLAVVAEAPGFRLELAPALTLSVAGEDIALPRDPGHAGFLRNDGIVGEHEALTGDGPVLATVDDGLAVMEIIAAAYLSAGSGSPVALPFEGDLDATPHQLWRGRG